METVIPVQSKDCVELKKDYLIKRLSIKVG
jgi:hypothetical protein